MASSPSSMVSAAEHFKAQFEAMDLLPNQFIVNEEEKLESSILNNRVLVTRLAEDHQRTLQWQKFGRALETEQKESSHSVAFTLVNITKKQVILSHDFMGLLPAWVWQ